MYRWLKKHGFPKEGFQLLCYNCNCAKGFFGKCPHKKQDLVQKQNVPLGTVRQKEHYL